MIFFTGKDLCTLQISFPILVTNIVFDGKNISQHHEDPSQQHEDPSQRQRSFPTTKILPNGKDPSKRQISLPTANILPNGKILPQGSILPNVTNPFQQHTSKILSKAKILLNGKNLSQRQISFPTAKIDAFQRQKKIQCKINTQSSSGRLPMATTTKIQPQKDTHRPALAVVLVQHLKERDLRNDVAPLGVLEQRRRRNIQGQVPGTAKCVTRSTGGGGNTPIAGGMIALQVSGGQEPA